MIYRTLSQKFSNELFKMLTPVKKVIVTGHHNPDDDALASVAAIRRAIAEKFPQKSVKIFITGKDAGLFIPDKEKMTFVKDAGLYLKDADALVLADTSRYNRFTDFPEKVNKFSGIKICIDHHATIPDKFDLGLIVPKAASCSELVFACFFKNKKINKDLAEIFLSGILSDTGDLAYLEPENFKIISLVKNLLEIYGESLEMFRVKHRPLQKYILKIMADILKNVRFAKINDWPECQYSFVSQSSAKKNRFSEDEIHEALDVFERQYIRSVKGYSWGFVLRQEKNDCKISLRSLPESVNVRKMMEKMSIGGGHDRAAGGTFKNSSVGQALKKVLAFMRQNKPVF